jgi:signal transduction histidine kinase
MEFVSLSRDLKRLILISLLISLLSWTGLTLATDVAAAVSLSQAERKWLAEHPEIVLATQAWSYPFEFFDDSGTYRGVAADYIALLEQRLGMRFKVLRAETPAQWQAYIKSGAVDIVAATARTSVPALSMQVARPHIVFPGVIVAGDKYPDLASLTGKKVAVIKGQQWGRFIDANAPQLQLTSMSDVATALEAISEGKVAALVSDMATASYYIHREGMTDINIVGRVEKDLELGIATRKDWPELNRIMEKVLAGISDEEHEAISRQWIHLKAPILIMGKTFWTLIFSGLATVLLTFLGFILWNRSLRQQVAARTRNLKQELEWRTAAEMEIQEAYEQLNRSHTELKETQLQLIRAAKMESIGSLAAGVAHEVKNPLMQIRLGLDYVRAELVLDRNCQAVVQDMENAVRCADSVINSLLDFSRENQLSLKLCRLNTVIEDSLTLVRHILSQNGIQVHLRLQDQLPKILLDENKIHQVFINLVHNAVQAMPRNGTLQISTYQSGPPGKKVLVAEVADSGPGIGKEDMGKIFDPFYTTKPVGKGSGLGLYVCRNILDLHGAEIELSNRNQGGLCVKVTFKTD